MAGKLIVFEGVEGSGKTTQIQRSHQWLQTTFPTRAKVIVTREPGDTRLGRSLRQLLLANTTQQQQIHSQEGKLIFDDSPPISELAELLLYAADRAQHVEEVLKPNLANGATILCDRYTDSTIAYQGYGRGLDRKIIDQLNTLATGGLESTLTLWLDVDVEISLLRIKSRGESDRIEQASLAFHRRVQAGYSELAKAYPDRIKRVDASLSEVALQAQIQDILLKYLAN